MPLIILALPVYTQVTILCTTYRQRAEKLEKDNLALYEKVRYLQNFQGQKNDGSLRMPLVGDVEAGVERRWVVLKAATTNQFL